MSASDRRFLDTNILVYAFSKDARATKALTLLGAGGVISAQCLNELANVLRGRMSRPWPFVHAAIAQVCDLCPTVVTLDLILHERGLAFAERFGFHIYDAMIVAAAFEAGCDTLYSEDLHDGMLIDGRLRIVNPFLEQ